jgi:hypothetical protein
MRTNNSGANYPSYGEIAEPVAIADNVNRVWFRIAFDFGSRTQARDVANFFYSTDGTTWTRIGPQDYALQYSLMEHFMGYKFGLVNYATQEAGGYVDFDYFHVEDGYFEG